MLYLNVHNLTKSYTSKVLIDRADFTISRGQKIALVAKNGAGKSTLLKVLMKEIDLTDGDIEWRTGLRVGYLPQDALLPGDLSVREYLFDMDSIHDWEQELELNIAINKLRIKPYLDQKIKLLSGGEKKRVALTKTLMGNPEMLILDEPTNHLDLDMIERLEWYLKNQHITLLMVTHDRYFLERVCTHIFELYRGKIVVFPGNYSYYLERKAIREENEKIEVHKLKQLYKKELHWMHTMPNARQTKSGARQQRFYTLDDHYDQRKDHVEQEYTSLQLSMQSRPLGGKILTIKHLDKSFGTKKIVSDFSHSFRHQERIGIIGKNGVGKSTFVRMIIGEESVDTGTIDVGETVVFGHYQQQDIHFPPDQRVSDIVYDRALLEQFLFPISQHHVFAEQLSGGEKRRLHLLTILQQRPNFLILDEPTNDLDLLTIQALETFLLTYQGCLLVVSHDRFFMDKITDHLFVFEGDGVIKDFWGNYQDYVSSSTPSVSSPVVVRTLRPSLSYLEKRELEQLEIDIERLKHERDEINKIFNHPDVPYDDIALLSESLGDILRELEQKESRWFELNQKIA